MKKKLDITLGSDPEVFIFDVERSAMVSAINVLQNDKETPTDLGDGIKMYADNALVETAFPPADSKDEFVERLGTALLRMSEVLGPKYKLHPQDAYTFERAELEQKKAWEIGCNPNFSAYTGEANEINEFPGCTRTGSFHIHVGNKDWEGDHGGVLMAGHSKRLAIKLLDVFVGCASVIFDQDPTAKARRLLYGKAGEYRPTKYGIEYRVLGNYAIRSPDTVYLVLALVDMAMDHIRNGTGEEFLTQFDPTQIAQTINECSCTLANSILVKAGVSKSHLTKMWEFNGLTLQRNWNIA